MRTQLLTTAAAVAAVVVLWLAIPPPRAAMTTGELNPDLRQRTLAGAFHVHSSVSDGSGTRAEIAAAAARAGLQFVVFTDHGDATRQPETPVYSSGVLCLDAVEISTDGGHYVAVGLPRAPYRLGGDPAGVVEDVRRLGGFGVVAHPDSPKPALAWRDWSAEADAVEWLNADSAWRAESWPSLIRSMLRYLRRPGAALAAMLDRPVATLARWDGVTARRRMPGLAGHDAHGGLGRSPEEGHRFGLSGIPSYEASFRSLSTRVLLRSRPLGSALDDASLVIDALRQGRVYTAIDGLAAPPWVDFHAEREGALAVQGERLEGVGPANLTVEAPALAGATIAMLRNGRVIAETGGRSLSMTAAGPGAYRVEVRRDGVSAAPWILSNPIYVDLPPESPAPVAPMAEPVASLAGGPWQTEHDPSSSAEASTQEGVTTMAFQLGRGVASPFAALVTRLPKPAAPFDAVVVDLVADAPARVSLQFRAAEGPMRWKRSVYVSADPHPVVVRVADLAPAEQGGGAFNPADAASLLLVVDLVNSVPGASGRISVRSVALARSR